LSDITGKEASARIPFTDVKLPGSDLMSKQLDKMARGVLKTGEAITPEVIRLAQVPMALTKKAIGTSEQAVATGVSPLDWLTSKEARERFKGAEEPTSEAFRKFDKPIQSIEDVAKKQEVYTPKNHVEELLLGTTSSIPAMVAAGAATALTGNPLVGGTIMGGITSGSEYLEALRSDATHSQAAISANISGAAEGLLSSISLGLWSKFLKSKDIASAPLERGLSYLGAMVGEASEEMGTEVIQFLGRKITYDKEGKLELAEVLRAGEQGIAMSILLGPLGAGNAKAKKMVESGKISEADIVELANEQGVEGNTLSEVTANFEKVSVKSDPNVPTAQEFEPLMESPFGAPQESQVPKATYEDYSASQVPFKSERLEDMTIEEASKLSEEDYKAIMTKPTKAEALTALRDKLNTIIEKHDVPKTKNYAQELLDKAQPVEGTFPSEIEGTVVENPLTVDDVQNLESTYGLKNFLDETKKYTTVEELQDNLYYHGSGGTIDNGIKVGSSLGDIEYGGGFGESQNTISLSKSKELASNFTGTSQQGKVYDVLLKKDSNVIERPDVEDAIDLEEELQDLYNQGVDAVKIGDWNEEFSEQELVVLNPESIVKGTKEDFKVSQKPRYENRNAEYLKGMVGEPTAPTNHAQELLDKAQPVEQEATEQNKQYYTGSSNPNITSFVPGGEGSTKTSGDSYGKGVYLTSNPNVASAYAQGDKGRVYNIDFDNPLLDLDGDTDENFVSVVAEALDSSTKQYKNRVLKSAP